MVMAIYLIYHFTIIYLNTILRVFVAALVIDYCCVCFCVFTLCACSFVLCT